MPPVAVDVSDTYVLVLTPANILLYERASGALKSALDVYIDAGTAGAANAAFPRFGAFSPDQAYVAVTGDDKSVRVWRPTDLRYGAEVLCERLPKRAGMLRWIPCVLENGTPSFEIVLADKFGDIWSFPVDPSSTPAPIQMVEEDDEFAVPRLGHVSMITAVDFLGDSVPYAIITSDRDEHIRISRWGQERLGYVIQQYLLGSRGAVGALSTLSAETSQRAGLPAGTDRPAILSSDGGQGLRLWCYTNGDYTLHSSLVLDHDKLASTVHVDADTERRRERAANNMAFRGAFDPAEAPSKRQKRDAEEPKQDGPTLIITKLVPLVVDSRYWLIITLDGASAFFTLPLEELREGSERPVPKDVIGVHDLGAPILDIAVHESSLWAVCDDRPGIASGTRPLHYLEWTSEGLKPAEIPGALAELAKPAGPMSDVKIPEPAKNELTVAPHTPRAIASDVTLSKLCLYTPLTTWPKSPMAEGHGSFLSQQNDPVSQDMVQRFQGGKRAAGRAKNQAKIREQFGQDAS